LKAREEVGVVIGEKRINCPASASSTSDRKIAPGKRGEGEKRGKERTHIEKGKKRWGSFCKQ